MGFFFGAIGDGNRSTDVKKIILFQKVAFDGKVFKTSFEIKWDIYT